MKFASFQVAALVGRLVHLIHRLLFIVIALSSRIVSEYTFMLLAAKNRGRREPIASRHYSNLSSDPRRPLANDESMRRPPSLLTQKRTPLINC
jgi:hypothetical protein